MTVILARFCCADFCTSGADHLWPHGVASPRDTTCNRWSSCGRAWPGRSTAPPQPRMVLLVRAKEVQQDLRGGGPEWCRVSAGSKGMSRVGGCCLLRPVSVVVVTVPFVWSMVLGPMALTFGGA